MWNDNFNPARNLQSADILQAQNDPNTQDVAHSPASQRVSKGEAGGIAGLQTRVPRHELQPGCCLPVRRRRKTKPPREKHQARGRHHDLKKIKNNKKRTS